VEERGNEYGLLSVTQKILNLPDCLSTKKSYDFLQSYKKIANESSFTEKNDDL